MRDLPAPTWPLPWWVVTLPAVLILFATAAVMVQPGGWTYIAAARVSGLPAEALLVVGPFVSLAACWVAERFTNRHSPLAAPILPRASGELGLRILGVLMVSWGLAFAVVAGGAAAVWWIRSTGSPFYPVEIAISVLRLEFFIVSGFAIGAVMARWYAILIALAWSVLWVLVLPLLYAVMLPDRDTSLEYFLFPAMSASNHQDLAAPVIGVVVVWWVCVLAALVLAVVGWFAVVARHSRMLFGAGAGGLGTVAAIGLGLPLLAPTPFVERPPPSLACSPGGVLEVCVTEEEQAVLPYLVPRVDKALARMGPHLPTDLQRVASFDALEALSAGGASAEDVLDVSFGSNGLGDVEFDVAVNLAGLSACDRNDPGILWAFAFASWLVPESPYADPPEYNPLTGVDHDTVLAWFAANAPDLRACTYSGDGPA